MGVVEVGQNNINMKDLFLDVRLRVESLKSPAVCDFTGRQTFTVEMLRKGIGFGIKNINIENDTLYGALRQDFYTYKNFINKIIILTLYI